VAEAVFSLAPRVCVKSYMSLLGSCHILSTAGPCKKQDNARGVVEMDSVSSRSVKTVTEHHPDA
jgi:hypothetical protein